MEGQRTRDRKVPEEVVERHLRQLKDLKARVAARELGQEGFSTVVSLSRRAVAAVKAVDLRA